MGRVLTDPVATHRELPAYQHDASAEAWRWECLVQAGVADGPACSLAASGSDLHAMIDAKAADCSDTLLVRIFA